MLHEFSCPIFHMLSRILNFSMADDDDEYEEGRDGSRLLEFMFGNIDGSGDLDIDYLDEVSIFSGYLLIHLHLIIYGR